KNLADNKMAVLGKYEKVTAMAEARKQLVASYNDKLEQLQKDSMTFVRAMALCLAGGEMALLRGVAEYEQRRQRLFAGTADDAEPALLHDFASRIALFETRLLRMQIAYTQALAVNVPSIQAIRESGNIE